VLLVLDFIILLTHGTAFKHSKSVAGTQNPFCSFIQMPADAYFEII